MKRKTLLIAALALLPWFAAAPSRAAEDALDQRINIGLRDADPADTFRSFAQIMGATPVIDGTLRGKVTIQVQNVRLRTLLDAVCESINCRWSLRNGQLLVAPLRNVEEALAQSRPALEEPIDLKVTKANVKNLLKTFGELLGAEVELDPRIEGTVDLDLEKTPVAQALDAVCEQAGCEWKFLEGGKSVLQFTPKK